jgi:transcriptional regulator with XRE-family HTH domain
MARRRAGFTQRELASGSRIPQSTISRIERGVISPSVDTLERLLRACDQELESVPVAGDRDLDGEVIDDHLDLSPAERAEHATLSGRAMMRFYDAARPEVGIPDPEFDPPAVLLALATRSVEFVVIGGFAAALRGSPVITDDVDICYAQTEANRGRLADALLALGGRVGGELPAPFEIEDALEIGERCSFETTAGAVDTIATPRATRGYIDLVPGADRLDIGDCFVLVPSLDDLVRMKVDGGQHDRLALRSLRATRKRQAAASR